MKKKELLIKLLLEKNCGTNKMTYENISTLTDYHVKSVIRINKVLQQKGAEIIKTHGNLGKKKCRHEKEELFILDQWSKCSEMNFSSFCRLYNKLVLDDSKYDFKPRSYSYIYNLLTKTGMKSPLRHSSTEGYSRLEGVNSLIALKDIKIEVLNKHVTLYLTYDSVSNQIIHMHLSQKDNKTNYYIMLRDIVKKYGIPDNICAHGLNIFRAPKNNVTQFHRMCNELNINIFLKHDRKLQRIIGELEKESSEELLKEIKIRGLGSIKEINQFLINEHMLTFNNSREKSKEKSIFTKANEGYIFENILCEKYKRKIVLQGSENNVQFKNILYHIENLETKLKRGTAVWVYAYLNGVIKINYNEKLYETSVIKKLSSKKCEPRY